MEDFPCGCSAFAAVLRNASVNRTRKTAPRKHAKAHCGTRSILHSVLLYSPRLQSVRKVSIFIFIAMLWSIGTFRRILSIWSSAKDAYTVSRPFRLDDRSAHGGRILLILAGDGRARATTASQAPEAQTSVLAPFWPRYSNTGERHRGWSTVPLQTINNNSSRRNTDAQPLAHRMEKNLALTWPKVTKSASTIRPRMHAKAKLSSGSTGTSESPHLSLFFQGKRAGLRSN
jgi:hypothetical protein